MPRRHSDKRTSRHAGADHGDSWVWQLLEGLLIFTSGTHDTGPGRTARDRVKLMLVLLTILFAVIAVGVTVGIVLAM